MSRRTERFPVIEEIVHRVSNVAACIAVCAAGVVAVNIYDYSELLDKVEEADTEQKAESRQETVDEFLDDTENETDGAIVVAIVFGSISYVLRAPRAARNRNQTPRQTQNASLESSTQT